jgi:hypothetical protein
MQDAGRSNSNHQNPILRGIRQGEAMHMKQERLKLGGGQA